MGGNPLAELVTLGQSVWLDDIGRDFICSGELKKLIEEDGVVGLTSNPTIFFKAITKGAAYDEETRRLAESGASTSDILETLMVDDIRLAAAELLPVFERTKLLDGWVSIEVAPAFAHDTQGTVSEAKRIRALVDRPNVFVKVPGTAEGIGAIRELVGQGLSINVTLIFSLDRYVEVLEAYLSGLELLAARRAAGDQLPGLPDVHSVASFFVSRVDTLVDKLLDERLRSPGGTSRSGVPGKSEDQGAASVRGKAAVANAKLAYELFRSTFAGRRWEALESQGANRQRPLWASTSTKNPAYSDILYVQELIGPHTVNTMPLSTMEAFRDHGRPVETITEGLDAARAALDAVAAEGISMTDVTSRLEVEGVLAFADSFESLYAAVDKKRAAFLEKAQG